MNSNNLNPTRGVSAGDKRKLSWPWLLASLAVALLLALNPAFSAFAAAGDLDPTFGGDGKVTTDFLGNGDIGRAVAMQSDGKIVAAGDSVVSATNNDFALSRYNADGSLDLNFDVDGKVTTDFFGGIDKAVAVAIQSDGKIVAAGTADHGTNANDFALARYNSNGSLDTTFSGNGKIVTDFLGRGDVAYTVAIQSDGKIVAAGVATGPSRGYFAVARYNPNGSLDTSFGGVGLVTTDFRVDAGGQGMAIQSNGKIVVAGFVSAVGFEDFALARYDPNGSLDTSFGGGDGEVTTDFFGNFDDAHAVAIQSDGKIVAAGSAQGTNANDFALVRYLSDGSLDTTFSGNGKVFTDFGSIDIAYAVALQSNGKIVAGGSTSAGVSGTYDFALARFNPNGNLDTTFSGDGKVTTDFSVSNDFVQALAIQGNGQIVVAGGSGLDFALARYDGDTPATPTPIAGTPTRTNTRLPTYTPTPTHTPHPTQTPGGPTATPTPFPCTIQFTDVLPGSTFYDFVRCMACRGTVSGYPDGTFRPANNVTRAQLAKIVSNSAGFSDPQGTQLFEDVPVNSTFSDYIGRLASRGYMSGYVCGGPGEPCGVGNLPYFRPSNNASRGQISKIVSNTIGFAEPAGAQMFEDVAPGSTFYDFIERLTSRGIIGGYQCGGPGEPCGVGNLPYFRPNANASRGQTSKFVSNTFFPNCQTY